ncbi:hypothetical protein FHX35_001669 [Auritidibacter ignavus]|nr:hypothetical protein [Auritidibacter ignavus]
MWSQPGHKQHLAPVNIADSGQDGLIQQRDPHRAHTGDPASGQLRGRVAPGAYIGVGDNLPAQQRVQLAGEMEKCVAFGHRNYFRAEPSRSNMWMEPDPLW